MLLSAPETDQFPDIQFRFDVYDSSGQFIQDLTPENVRVIEDGQELQPNSVETIQNGLQIILVLNTGPSLGQLNNGVPEYQRIQAALVAWAKKQTKPSIDDYSLATPTGLFLIRSNEPAQLVKSLSDYQPDLQKFQPNLNSLAEALDLATDPLSAPRMKRSILYITPPIEGADAAPLADLADRAREIGVRVNVWVMSPDQNTGESAPAAGKPDQPATLQTLAEETGGQYFQVAPSQALPEIEPLFDPQRKTYQVQYTSGIQKSGDHRLNVQISNGVESLTSTQQQFELSVEPPNPIFLSPPATLERSWTLKEGDKQPVLSPAEVPLQIVVEFPDSHPRELKSSRLYVNDQLVDENTEPPFDHFSWVLETQGITASHQLRVEAVDMLGLTGTSIEIPVEVVVEQPAKASLFESLSERGMIAMAAVILSGAALALVLVLTSSRRWIGLKNRAVDKKRLNDPVTQPVNIRQEQSRPRKSKVENPDGFAAAVSSGGVPAAGNAASNARPTWPPAVWHSSAWQRAHAQAAPARLIQLDENDQPITGGVLPLSRLEITFGSDPRRATQVLDSATVDPLHARLYRAEDSKFLLADLNSIAGTWINYAPVSEAGTSLEHGDLIHIGKVVFRFELTDPSKIHATEVRVVSLDKTP